MIDSASFDAFFCDLNRYFIEDNRAVLSNDNTGYSRWLRYKYSRAFTAFYIKKWIASDYFRFSDVLKEFNINKSTAHYYLRISLEYKIIKNESKNLFYVDDDFGNYWKERAYSLYILARR